MKKSQLAINSVSTRGPLEETLAAYAKAGFGHVEFILGPVREVGVAQTKRLLDAHSLNCIGGFDCALQAFSAPAARAENHQRIVQNAQLLSELGAANLVVGTDGPTEPDENSMGILAQSFAEVAAQTEPLGVSLLIEFNWSPFVKSLRTAVEIARKSGAKNVGVLFDPAHYHCTPTKFEQINADSVPFIRHVHVNNMSDKPGELSNSNADRVLPGFGCLDLPKLFGQLEKFGYDSYFSIEMFSETLWQMPVEEAAHTMYQSLLPLCEEGL